MRIWRMTHTRGRESYAHAREDHTNREESYTKEGGGATTEIYTLPFQINNSIRTTTYTLQSLDLMP